jgi:hypothetical protein
MPRSEEGTREGTTYSSIPRPSIGYKKLEVGELPGIPTHKPVDINIKCDRTGPRTRSLMMPTHAADLFEAGIAAELAQSTATVDTTSDLENRLHRLELAITNDEDELREAPPDARRRPAPSPLRPAT